MKKTTVSIQGDFLPNLCTSQSVIGLLLAGELLALALVLSQLNTHTLFWSQMGVVSMTVQWIVLPSAGMLCGFRPIFKHISPIASGILAYSMVLVIAAIVLAVGQHVFNSEPQFRDIFVHLLIAAIFAGMILRYLYLQQQLHNQRRAELQSRIHALQARIKPHFLFNSMNTIASLIKIDADAAETAVEDLSELFRFSLQCPDLIPLTDELSLCRRYVAIEQVRLGDRLQVEWQCDQFPETVQIPGLSLQPLIENAICHGIQHLRVGGLVEVIVNTDDVDVFIQIRNPFPAHSTHDGTRGHDLAIGNINHRLQAHYGQKASLQVQIKSGNSIHNDYIVTMRLPVC